MILHLNQFPEGALLETQPRATTFPSSTSPRAGISRDYPRPRIILVMEIQWVCSVEPRLPCLLPFGEEIITA